MGHKIVYQCDRCTKIEDTATNPDAANNFYHITVAAHRCGQSTYNSTRVYDAIRAIWCDECCAIAGFHKRQDVEPIKPPPSLDDIIRDIVHDAMANKQD